MKQQSRTNIFQTEKQPLEFTMLGALADELDPSGAVTTNDYEKFKVKYFHNLAGFAADCVIWEEDESLTDYQSEGMKRLVKHKRFSMRGPHGLGKTMFAAVTVLWFALTRDGQDWKIPVLASAWRQLTKYLFPEIHKWSKRLRWDVIGRKPFTGNELLQLNLRLSTGEAFAIASDNAAYIEGAHAKHMLYVFDESKVIPDETWDAAEGAFSTGECFIGDIFVNGLSPQAVSRRWYEGIVIEVKTRAGHKVTVTPNHPVLTPDGWVKFGSLKLGDKIISCRDSNSLMMGIKPDAKQVPSRIQDIFKSAEVVDRPVPAVPIMLSSENLNSPIPDTKINVVSTDSFLWSRIISKLKKKIKNILLIQRSNNPILFSRNSSFNKLSIGFFLSKITMSSLCRSAFSFFRLGFGVGNLGLFDIPSLNPVLTEPFTNNASRNFKFNTQFVDRSSGEVAINNRLKIIRLPFNISSTNMSSKVYAVNDKVTGDCTGRDAHLATEIDSIAPGNIFIDEIVDLRRAEFKGHVYNLQTETHWYTANYNSNGGILVHNCYWLAISTPGEQSGRFYDIHSHKAGYEDWNTLFVTLAMAIKAKRINPDWAEQRRKQWGESSAVYKNRVLGEFAASRSDSVISLSDIERSNIRWLERQDAGQFKELTGIGADIGRGADKSVIAREYDDNAIYELERLETTNSMELVGRIVGIMLKWVLSRAVIDLGYDPGVYDAVRENERCADRAIPFVSNSKTDFVDETGEFHFTNLRSAAYWNLREMLKNDEYDLPPDDTLTGDLTAPTWKVMSGGKIAIEGKDETKEFGRGIRAKLGRSTDDGDAVVMVAFKRNIVTDDEDFGGSGQVEDYSDFRERNERNQRRLM